MLEEITSLQNPYVKHLVKLQSDRGYRNAQKRVVIEGIKMVEEVCKTEKTHAILATDRALLPKTGHRYLISQQVLEKIAGSKSPEGIIAEVEIPKSAALKGNYLLALDGISDPGNLGSLLRTALALGWQGVFLLPHCCDPFNDKALRSAKGATFRIPLCQGSWEDLVAFVEEKKIQVLVAHMEGALPENVGVAKKRLLLLGSESLGVSKKALQAFTSVQVPMKGDMESLNVAIAGGILMYALREKN